MDHFTSWGIRNTKPGVNDEAFEFMRGSGLGDRRVMRPSHMRQAEAVPSYEGHLPDPEFRSMGLHVPKRTLFVPERVTLTSRGGGEEETMEKGLASLPSRSRSRYYHRTRRYDDQHAFEASRDIEEDEAARDHSDDMLMQADVIRHRMEAGLQFAAQRGEVNKRGKVFERMANAKEAPDARTASIRALRTDAVIRKASRERPGRVYSGIAEAIMARPTAFGKIFKGTPVTVRALRSVLEDISIRRDSDINEAERRFVLNIVRLRLHETPDIAKSQEEIIRHITYQSPQFKQRYTRAHNTLKPILDRIPAEHRTSVKAVIFEMVRKNLAINSKSFLAESKRLNMAAKVLNRIVHRQTGRLDIKTRQYIADRTGISIPTLMIALNRLNPRRYPLRQNVIRELDDDLARRADGRQIVYRESSERPESVILEQRRDEISGRKRTRGVAMGAGRAHQERQVSVTNGSEQAVGGVTHALPGQFGNPV